MLTVTELKAVDPKRFDREYCEWLSGGFEFDADDEIDYFKDTMAELGLTVSDVRWQTYPRAAGVSGGMTFPTLIKLLGKADEYLPLLLDSEEYGAHVKFDADAGHSVYQKAGIDYQSGNCRPVGVFKDLPEEEWAALVSEMYDKEYWEKLATEWVATHTSKLARDIEDSYDYAGSEEAYIEMCEANDVEFDDEI